MTVARLVPFSLPGPVLPRLLGLCLSLAGPLPSAHPEIDLRGAAIRLDLISEVRSIRPGEPFRVGLRIHHEPGWHTYWRQPGIVGIPPSLTWALPAGFAAGPIQWPTPERVQMGGLTAWGFERDVLLMVRITPPPQGAGTRSVTLRAKGAWMACARTCHPGWGDFQLSLPIGERTVPDWDPAHRALFVLAEKELPPALEGWQATARTDPGGNLRLRLLPLDPALAPAPDERWYFYGYHRQVHSDEPQAVVQLPGGGVELILRPFPIPDPPSDHLEGVLEVPASDGSHRVFAIRAPWHERPIPPDLP